MILVLFLTPAPCTKIKKTPEKKSWRHEKKSWRRRKKHHKFGKSIIEGGKTVNIRHWSDQMDIRDALIGAKSKDRYRKSADFLRECRKTREKRRFRRRKWPIISCDFRGPSCDFRKPSGPTATQNTHSRIEKGQSVTIKKKTGQSRTPTPNWVTERIDLCASVPLLLRWWPLLLCWWHLLLRWWHLLLRWWHLLLRWWQHCEKYNLLPFGV